MERSRLIDVCKGIGIVSIVIGHASWTITLGTINIAIGPFVYLFHLAIFFFCAGYTYKEREVGTFIIKRLKSLYIPFVVYSCLYLAFRNCFIHMGILESDKFSFDQYIIALTNILTFNGVSEFLSAFWFLPVMFFTMCIYNIINALVYIIPVQNKEILKFLLCAGIGCLGIYTTEKGFGLLYNMQIAYLMVLIVEIGHIYKNSEMILTKFINYGSLLISLIILIWVIKLDIGIIELSKFMIINKWVFYPVTFVGMIFCVSLGKIIGKIKNLERVFIYMGKNSFDIMALHFLGFKLFDYIICHVQKDYTNLGAFPRSYDKFWYIYIAVGVTFPLAIKKIYDLVSKKIMTKIRE